LISDAAYDPSTGLSLSAGLDYLFSSSSPEKSES
jgi:hypothetical protein